jgi:hypothetical protein
VRQRNRSDQNPVSRTIALNGFTFSWCIDAAHDQYRTGTRLVAKTTGFRMKRMARSDIRVCIHPSISVSGGRCNTQRNGLFYERSPTRVEPVAMLAAADLSMLCAVRFGGIAEPDFLVPSLRQWSVNNGGQTSSES